ncbi:uracil-DNA glycosylase [Mariprofundus sp. EBB-1]|nr:uracil-DNA glycosylase [Mariprofundus sp. EBB-1]
MADDLPTTAPPCRSCRFYFITWDKHNPHGCRAFGFKSKMIPCMSVKSASSMQCLQFQPKEKKPQT